MFLLVACDRPERSAGLPAVAAASASANVDRGSGDKYRYDIRYLSLPAQDAPLAAAMRAYAERQKRDFLENFGDDTSLPEGANRPWRMRLDFALRLRNDSFVSVLGTGEAYSGGAHGNPLLASFVLHRPSRRVLALPELFVNADAGLRVLAAESRRALRERLHDDGDARRIDDGTAPKAENYAVFAIDGDERGQAKGLVVIFPAYQVAPYAQGPQEVTVPAARFRDLLKAEFKNAFVVTAAK